MKESIFPIFLALLLAVAGCNAAPQPTTSPTAETARALPRLAAPSSGTNFDFYLLNLSWAPEFCHSHPAAAECGAHATFVLHGLWPQNGDGTYPENCSDAPGPSNPSEYSDIYPDPGLLQHEWRTHGTCSGLSANAFFNAARSAFHSVMIPPELESLTSRISLPPERILSLFTASNPAIPRAGLALSCGHNYLTAVKVCLDKSLQPIACSGVRSCRANTVRIPGP